MTVIGGMTLTRIARCELWPAGHYIAEWRGKRYRIWPHKGTIRWSGRREEDPSMAILGQGRTLKECVEYLKRAIRAANG